MYNGEVDLDMYFLINCAQTYYRTLLQAQKAVNDEEAEDEAEDDLAEDPDEPDEEPLDTDEEDNIESDDNDVYRKFPTVLVSSAFVCVTHPAIKRIAMREMRRIINLFN